MKTIKRPAAGEPRAKKNVAECLQNTALIPVCQVSEIFLKPGEVIEIRALGLTGKGPWEGWAKGTVSGYFNDPAKFAAAVKSLDDLKRASGIYFCMNPVNPALLARANNRLIVPQNTTTDEQVACERWLLIDTDPKRPPGISATDAELAAAIACRNAIADYLHEHGFPEPILAYSGNGGHLLIRLPDLPNTAEIAQLKKQALKALKFKFDNDDIHVDPTVSNASRITKLYGTLARKGDSMSDRPHRRSYLEIIPDPMVPVTIEQLQWLASLAPEEKPNNYAAQSQTGRNGTGKEKCARKILESCCEKIRQSPPGDQHHIRRDAARLIGGHLHYIDESEVLSALEQAVEASGAQNMRAAMKTVKDGLEHGKEKPITIPGIETAQSHSGSISPGQAEPQADLLDFEIREKPHLDLSQFSGITKALVELATKNSEADPAAVLFTFLARFGVEVGRNPYFRVGDTVHHGRLDCVVVGDSSKSRKGTSEKPVNSFFSFNSLYVSEKNVYKIAHTSPGPFSSGEGVIYKVHDQVKTWDTKTQSYQITDPGISDKRLFICDEEFNNVLANVKREGNTLSMVIRKAWDDGTFEPLTKNSRMSATNAHVGWVCHITGYELQAKLSECEGFNGFCNRILWVFARRQKLVPLPEPMPTKELAELQRLLLIVLGKCHEHEKEILFTEKAREAWINKYYRKLSSQNGNGLLGVVLNRGEAQVRRLALLFTLLDSEVETSLKHLNQAMTAWKYCEDSASYIFKGQAQDSVARKILAALQDKGQLTSTEISNLFARNIKSDRLQQAIQELVTSDMAEMVSGPTKGRPSKTLKLKRTNEINEIRSDLEVSEGLKSFKSYKDSKKNDGLGCSDYPDEEENMKS